MSVSHVRPRPLGACVLVLVLLPAIAAAQDRPTPPPVTVTYADGSTHIDRVPVDTWLEGHRTATLTAPSGDGDRSNNTWTAADSKYPEE